MLTPGTQLGPYQILSALGAGGMGEVYRARDPRLGREVAVKVLPASVASDSGRLRRFEQEARAASALNHPNILTVFDVGTTDGVSYLVTELLAGGTLREHLASGAVAPRKAVGTFCLGARGSADGRGLHRAGNGPRHRRLHEPRAGARSGRGRTFGSLQLRRRALRDARGPAGIDNVRMSNDGTSFEARVGDGSRLLISIEGATPPRVLPGPDGLTVWGFSADDRALFVSKRSRPPLEVDRYDLATGARTPWRRLGPTAPSGIAEISLVAVTPDGRAYSYQYERMQASDLFVVEGIR